MLRYITDAVAVGRKGRQPLQRLFQFINSFTKVGDLIIHRNNFKCTHNRYHSMKKLFFIFAETDNT